MQLDLFFPTPVWWEQTNINNDDMIKLCYRLREEDTSGRILSNQGGWQSMDFRPGTHPEMKELEDKITEQLNNCFRDYGYNAECAFPVIENIWFNINSRGNTNSVHIHDNSFISGAYYLQARPEQGNITFYKSFYQDYITASQAPIAEYTGINSSAITFQPETSKIIFFPGFLPHGVERNDTDEDRISLSFNTKIIRTDDERYRTTHIE